MNLNIMNMNISNEVQNLINITISNHLMRKKDGDP